MADQFPTTDSESIGQFVVVPKLPDGTDPDKSQVVRTGVLRYRPGRVELEVSPSFNPMTKWTESTPGRFTGTSNDELITDEAVILGTVVSSPQGVSLWQIDSLRRNMIGFSSPGREEAGREVLSAEWCLMGTQFPDEDVGFTSVTLDVTGLHRFADLPSVHPELPEQGLFPMRWVLDPPDAVVGSTEIPHKGSVTLAPAVRSSPPGRRDVQITTDTVVRFGLDQGARLPEVVSDLAIPMASLLTILTGEECSVRGLRVEDGEDRSAAVYGYVVDPSAPRDTKDLLLAVTSAGGPDFIGRWLAIVKQTSPVPQILAAAYAGEFMTVETEALSLCTAAETLHRCLFPDARRLSSATVEQGLAGLVDATLPSDVHDILSDALGTYLFEPSFPSRMADLAEPVFAAVPSCIGRLNRWKQVVTAQRVGLAHGLRNDDTDMATMHAVNRSLRWMLTVRLLLAAGVEPAVLREATEANRRYERDLRNWKRVLPKVFQ
ncbi:Uncharacterised protein (plasmid) [Tsukamurella tyrosinosolvens]|uniref:ApeA N-terminal domain-containing protein n=1 Tax=Tsukamurella tyrosinosolvens TaxID=57704 RepID=A0A1H4WJ24_TSUTY|nr:HEPN domain-containing protein [Tsukamurella tyrosinosolvens]KXO99404.1 hypothetical protein AXK58_24065 [Tsukamurella tyrosinosolvens]SEC93255.1 hypothetical protein SAMN04489793_3576 [Tsukamurella tyrosinosolvens]VEH89380.1 Uncharacterised protein [Tsukamurella tyrosinosolvens]